MEEKKEEIEIEDDLEDAEIIDDEESETELMQRVLINKAEKNLQDIEA